MSLLLDTHFGLWSITGDATLSENFLDQLRYDSNIFPSPGSMWEIK